MKVNPLRKLESLGQSIWIDFIRRDILDSGELLKLIKEDGVSGVTSNPSIFEKAIIESDDYDEAVHRLSNEGKQAAEIYDALTIEDITNTADLFRPTYKQKEGRDGFVSIEVSPHLAHDTEGTNAEARRLWQAVDRPNVMIKVPATVEGLPAIQQLIGEGININITLLFGLPRYRQVVDAYLSGLEKLCNQGKRLDQVASVASFFLSRIDVLVDPILEKIMQDKDHPKSELAGRIHGQLAIASAKAAYEIYEEIISSSRFRALALKGARPQCLLWASTSTKNPAYSDLKYIEPLIGPNTINTLPLETLAAYRDHGDPELRLKEGVSNAHWYLENLKELGIELDAVTQKLEDEGVEKFNKAYDLLIKRLGEKKKESFIMR
jgi:transaldolase